ncbi:MAG: UDP-3-O-(3-hydroxymyristoyl)glucosamine N-acyltransferase [Acidobacteriota bacterium]|nr:UDP-3-O-(3-hydroxymyristoyl)glucosamine N-acyltransferase [Acidobacteriota bacterium]
MTPTSLSLGQIAERLGAELNGDHSLQIHGVAAIDAAGPGELTFVSNPKYIALAGKTQATAVIVEPEFPEIAAATLRVKNPYLAFARAIELFYQPPRYLPGVHPTAVVAPTARIGANAHIGACAVIGEHVTVGDDAVILPHVVLYPYVIVGNRFFAHAHAVVREYCQLGDNVVLQNGAIIGADGFGYARDGAQPAGSAWRKILQSGPAILEDNVEVQANACIDRASIGETRVRAGAKIDNLVQVGHGCTVGQDTLLCAQVGLAGSTRVGDNVIFAGQAASAGHNSIGDGAIVTAQSGVGNDVPPGKTVSGSPAFDNLEWLRSTVYLQRLPQMMKQMKRDLAALQPPAKQATSRKEPR